MRNIMGSTKSLPPVLTETRFNINHMVRVRLTDRGKEVLLEKVQEESKLSRIEATRSIKTRFLRGNEYSFQLYELMAIFGSTLPTFATSDPRFHPFEGNNIILLPDPYDVRST